MIVSILQNEGDGSAIQWFCDYDKANFNLRGQISTAIKSEDKYACALEGTDHENNIEASVEPPCQIDDAITLMKE